MRKVPEFNEITHKGKAKDKSGTTYKIKLQMLKRFSFQVLLIMYILFPFLSEKKLQLEKIQQSNSNNSNTSLVNKKKKCYSRRNIEKNPISPKAAVMNTSWFFTIKKC